MQSVKRARENHFQYLINFRANVQMQLILTSHFNGSHAKYKNSIPSSSHSRYDFVVLRGFPNKIFGSRNYLQVNLALSVQGHMK